MFISTKMAGSFYLNNDRRDFIKLTLYKGETRPYECNIRILMPYVIEPWRQIQSVRILTWSYLVTFQNYVTDITIPMLFL